MELFNFQKKAIKQLLKNMFIKNENKIIFKAPTGSGKTIIMSYFIDVINEIKLYGISSPFLSKLDFSVEELSKFDFAKIQTELEKNEFVWISPSTGGLAIQSKNAYEDNFNSKTKTLNEFILSAKAEENITFIGTSSINSENNTARKKSEKMNWVDAVNKKKLENTTFIVIFDECHMGDTETRIQLLEELNPIYQIHVSATPDLKDNDFVIEITDDEVIDEGLITKSIKINKELALATTENENDEIELLIDTAIKKYKEIKAEYDKLYKEGQCGLINPLIVVQYPNKNYGDKLFDIVNKYITQKIENPFNENQIAVWMTINKEERKQNLDNITDNNNPVVFLHMKQAAGTGWNCPRAKILIKLREKSSEAFDTQVIGRFRRMPERKHYDNELLDNCFIYTYDNEWLKKGKETGSLLDNKIIFLKKENIKIEKEIKNKNAKIISEKELREIIQDFLFKKYNLTNDKKMNKELLKNYGFVFEDHVIVKILEGTAVHTEQIKNESGLIDKKRKINENSIILEKGYSIINSKTKINNLPITKKILQKLFKKQENPLSKDNSGFILDLDTSDFICFIVNNNKLIYKDIREALQKTQEQSYQRNKSEIKKITISLPEKYEIKNDTRIKKPVKYNKNAYEEVNTAIVGSTVEKKFNLFIDNYNDTDWWMKNNDSGEEFLSIVYITITGKQYQFYPDYICKINNKIWVLETKGGENIDGENENIDPQAENKFYALKDWAETNNLNFGFIRYSKLQDKLYISNTEYQEELNLDKLNTPWKEISSFDFK